MKNGTCPDCGGKMHNYVCDPALKLSVPSDNRVCGSVLWRQLEAIADTLGDDGAHMIIGFDPRIPRSEWRALVHEMRVLREVASAAKDMRDVNDDGHSCSRVGDALKKVGM